MRAPLGSCSNATACEASPLVNASFRSWGQRVGLLTLERTVWVLKLHRTVGVGAKGQPHDWRRVGRSGGSPAWARLATAHAVVHIAAQGRRNRNHRGRNRCGAEGLESNNRHDGLHSPPAMVSDTPGKQDSPCLSLCSAARRGMDDRCWRGGRRRACIRLSPGRGQRESTMKKLLLSAAIVMIAASPPQLAIR
jgi:hypothetical protein